MCAYIYALTKRVSECVYTVGLRWKSPGEFAKKLGEEKQERTEENSPRHPVLDEKDYEFFFPLSHTFLRRFVVLVDAKCFLGYIPPFECSCVPRNDLTSQKKGERHTAQPLVLSLLDKIHRGDESRARRIESWTKVLVSPVSAELIAYAVLVEEVRRKTDV